MINRFLLISIFLFFNIPLVTFALDYDLIEQEIFKLVNLEREKLKIPPLKYDEKLATVARIHSQNMFTKKFFSHNDPEGSTPFDRVNKYYPELIAGIGENIAYTYNSTYEKEYPGIEKDIAETLMKSWMNSPGHRENILKKNFNIIGVGVYKQGCTVYGTQNFGDGNAIFINENNENISFPIKVKYNETKKIKFKFIGSYPKDKITIFVIFPDKNAKYFINNNTFYTGLGKYSPNWIDNDTFEINLKFDKGKGLYKIHIGNNNSFYEESYISFITD